MHDPTVTRFEAAPFAIPYREPVRFAGGELVAGEHVLLTCELDDGTVAHGEAIPRLFFFGETQASLLSVIRDVIAPRLIGMRLWDPGLIARVHAGVAHNNVARGAVEQALWFARARSAGVPLRRLLGSGRPRLPVAWMIGLGAEDAMVAEAREAHARGYRALKLKGGVDPELDVAVYRRVREALPDVLAYIDANLGYAWPDARRVARELASHGLRYLEEPMPPGDPLRAELWRSTGVGIIADETATTAGAVWEHLRTGAAQAISVKVARTGVEESRRIASTCTAAGVPVVVGTQGETTLGTYLAAEVAASLDTPRLLTTELSHDEVFAGGIAVTDLRRDGAELVLGDDVHAPTIDPEAYARFAG